MAQHTPTLAGYRNRANESEQANRNRPEAIAMRRIICEHGRWLSPFMEKEPLPELTEWEQTVDLQKLGRGVGQSRDMAPVERQTYPRRDAFEVKPPPAKTSLQQRLDTAKDSYSDAIAKHRRKGREMPKSLHDKWQGIIAGIETSIRRQNAPPEEKAKMQQEAIQRILAVKEQVEAKAQGRKPVLPSDAPVVTLKRKAEPWREAKKKQKTPEDLEAKRQRERERKKKQRQARKERQRLERQAIIQQRDPSLPTAKELIAEAKDAQEREERRRAKHREKERRRAERRKQQRLEAKKTPGFVEGYTKQRLENDLDFANKFMIVVKRGVTAAIWNLEKKGVVITQTVLAQQHYKFVQKYMIASDIDHDFIEKKLLAKLSHRERCLKKLKEKHAQEPPKVAESKTKRRWTGLYKKAVKEVQKTCSDHQSL